MSISLDYGLSETGILKALGRSGVEKRDPASARRVCPLNEQAFAVPSPEADYWAGFLMADGSVQPDGRMAVILQANDAGHLDAFRCFLGSQTKPIAIRTIGPGQWAPEGSRYAHIQFDSLPLVTDLARYGVVPRKTWTATAGEQAALSPAFWRGCMDGDGCISFHSRTGSPTVSLFGTQTLTGQFAAYIGSLLPDRYVPRVSKVREDSLVLHGVTVGGNRAREVLRHVYPRGAFALARKRPRADRVLAWVGAAEARQWAA